MPLQDDQTITPDAVLYRVLKVPSWITTKGQTRRPSSIAFYEDRGEVSFFEEGPDVLSEIRRIFPGVPIARVPASTIREAGLAIERSPNDAPPNLQCDNNKHVVVGPSEEITRLEFQRRARWIAKHASVTIIEPDPPPAEPGPATEPEPEPKPPPVA
jgi:hypothetical protein